MIEEEGKCRAEAEARGLPVQQDDRKQEGGKASTELKLFFILAAR